MNKIKHIIWDWNGTLVDDAWLFVELMNKVLKKRGLPLITLTDYKNTFCFPLEKYYQNLGFNFNDEPYEIPSMEFVDFYNTNKFRPILYPRATELINKIKRAGINNYILSAQNHHSLLELVDFYNLKNLFKEIKGTDNLHARGKDLMAEQLLDFSNKADNVLFIGDTNLDVQIATHYQSHIIGLTFGHQSKDRFPVLKNLTLVDSFEDLYSYLTLKLMENQ